MEVPMRDAIPTHLEAGSPSLMPRLLTGLLLCGALLPAVAAPASACGLNWADPAVVWTATNPPNLGPHTFPLTGGGCPPGATVTITVTPTPGSGIFRPFPPPSTPAEDCGLPECLTNEFGPSHDLALSFDPDPDKASPITITVTFSSPLTNVAFEISDIDFGGGAPGSERLDQVVVNSNAGAPTLSFKPPTTTPPTPRTFSIDAVNATATANCNPGPFPTCSPATDTTQTMPQLGENQDPDAGTVKANFGALSVTTVTITYKEAGDKSNPAGRGIGILANLTATTATPVELTGFTIE